MAEPFQNNIRCQYGPNKCDQPSVFRYEAMGGGWCYLCGAHGERHRAISEHITEGLGKIALETKSGRACRDCGTRLPRWHGPGRPSVRCKKCASKKKPATTDHAQPGGEG